MRPDNSRHLVTAAKRRHELARAKAIRAIRELGRAGSVPISFESVARAAGVSRSWLYTQPDLREEIQRLRAATAAAKTAPMVPHQQKATADSLRRRLATIQERIRQLTEENQRLRHQLAVSLGQQRATPTRSDGSNHSSVTIPPF
jgi:septal ring factor EnvC (AmiA/AmiB activator)